MILATLGPSTTDADLLSIVAGRPLLALYLPIGLPSASPVGPLEYLDPLELLENNIKEKKDSLYSLTGWRGARYRS